MEIFDINKYDTLVFDCDGVILNSNKIKTDAFHTIALPYGEVYADMLVQYHISNGGISRYDKVSYFLCEILGQEYNQNKIEDLLNGFAQEVARELLKCEIVEGLFELKAKYAKPWMLVSGGDQEELRTIFAQRDIASVFDAGIFGSPDSKDTIFKRELKNGAIRRPAVYFGDSKYDYVSSTNAGMDFVFISQWSEFRDWEAFFSTKDVPVFSDFVSMYS